MAIFQLSLGVKDADGDKGWTGLTYEATAAGDEAAYIAAINAASDGVVSNIKEIAVLEVSGDATGDERVEHVGNVVLREVGHPKNKWTLQIPAISEANVEKPTGRGVSPRVGVATVGALVAAFSTLTGVAVGNLEVVDNFISQRKR